MFGRRSDDQNVQDDRNVPELRSGGGGKVSAVGLKIPKMRVLGRLGGL